MTDDDADYVTVLPVADALTSIPTKAIVAVMHYRRGEDDYIQGRVSRVLPLKAAQALAESWAAALGLEVR